MPAIMNSASSGWQETMRTVMSGEFPDRCHSSQERTERVSRRSALLPFEVRPRHVTYRGAEGGARWPQRHLVIPTCPLEERLRDLMSRMTLAEKVSQMVYESPAIPRLEIPEYNWWNEGLHGVGRGRATGVPAGHRPGRRRSTPALSAESPSRYPTRRARSTTSSRARATVASTTASLSGARTSTSSAIPLGPRPGNLR